MAIQSIAFPYRPVENPKGGPDRPDLAEQQDRFAHAPSPWLLFGGIVAGTAILGVALVRPRIDGDAICAVLREMMTTWVQEGTRVGKKQLPIDMPLILRLIGEVIPPERSSLLTRLAAAESCLPAVVSHYVQVGSRIAGVRVKAGYQRGVEGLYLRFRTELVVSTEVSQRGRAFRRVNVAPVCVDFPVDGDGQLVTDILQVRRSQPKISVDRLYQRTLPDKSEATYLAEATGLPPEGLEGIYPVATHQVLVFEPDRLSAWRRFLPPKETGTKTALPRPVRDEEEFRRASLFASREIGTLPAPDNRLLLYSSFAEADPVGWGRRETLLATYLFEGGNRDYLGCGLATRAGTALDYHLFVRRTPLENALERPGGTHILGSY